MEQKILLISGKKQSGKDSAANYLTGFLLKKNEMIDKFSLDEEGKLLIPIMAENATTGQPEEQWGILDLSRLDMEYVRYADRNVWPIIKAEHFGDILKDVCRVLFGLDRNNLWGTDNDKNKPTSVKWEDVYKLVPKLELDHIEQGLDKKDEVLSHRELLEVFGTDICRVLYNDCWVQALFTRVVEQGYPFIVIADCRFPHEIDYAKKLGAKVVRLTRNPKHGKHFAETALDDYEGFDFVIDNEKLTQEEKGAKLVEYLQSIGWI